MKVIDDTTKRRVKRSLRRHKRETMESVAQADEKIERLLIRRFDRLVSVRRFIGLWVSLFVLLFLSVFYQLRAMSPYYQSLQPVPGGLYNEGLIGTFTNANPLYATGAADTAVSRIVFSGLFKYDSANQLVGDLATGYDLSPSQMRYSVHLRHNVAWQDGKVFTADDVVYTYKTIQDIESQSPLYSSWQGIIVTKVDAYTVNFDLPNALSAFPYSLTNGIVPAHLLSSTIPSQLRSSSFNTQPIGTGPFQLKFVEVTGNDPTSREQHISLAPFKHYWAGAPKLDGLSLITYSDDIHLADAFGKKQLNAMSGLDNVPEELSSDKSIRVYRTPLTTAVMAFFNNSRPNLNDASVRQALVKAVDQSKLKGLVGAKVKLVKSPLLEGQLGYDPSITQAPYDLDGANQMLNNAGWAMQSDGVRTKDGRSLSLSLSAQNSTDYTKVAEYLQKEWAKVGAKVQVSYYSSDDLQTSVIGSHSYDILLYGINIGVDPDVFAYWDSSQVSLTSQGHLNLSEYKSAAADSALEGGRTRSDPAIRAVKYKGLLTAWANDAPALGLYQPSFLYITRGPVFNYDRTADNSSTDRFYNVAQWEIRQQRQTLK